MRRQIKARWKYLLLGLGYGYPICCVLRFMADPLDVPSACVRGFKYKGGEHEGGWVPCCIFHQPDETAQQVCAEIAGEEWASE